MLKRITIDVILFDLIFTLKTKNLRKINKYDHSIKRSILYRQNNH